MLGDKRFHHLDEENYPGHRENHAQREKHHGSAVERKDHGQNTAYAHQGNELHRDRFHGDTGILEQLFLHMGQVSHNPELGKDIDVPDDQADHGQPWGKNRLRLRAEIFRHPVNPDQKMDRGKQDKKQHKQGRQPKKETERQKTHTHRFGVDIHVQNIAEHAGHEAEHHNHGQLRKESRLRKENGSVA